MNEEVQFMENKKKTTRLRVGKDIHFSNVEEMMIYIEEHKHEYDIPDDPYMYTGDIKLVDDDDGYEIPKELLTDELMERSGGIAYCANEAIARAYFTLLNKNKNSQK